MDKYSALNEAEEKGREKGREEGERSKAIEAVNYQIKPEKIIK